MTDEPISEERLKALAEAADACLTDPALNDTSGPYLWFTLEELETFTFDEGGTFIRKAAREYIAAASPSRILALLAEKQRLEAILDEEGHASFAAVRARALAAERSLEEAVEALDHLEGTISEYVTGEFEDRPLASEPLVSARVRARAVIARLRPAPAGEAAQAGEE